MSSQLKNHPAIKAVHPEAEFIFKDGKRIKNVPELVEVMTGCSDDEFLHHCNDSKNDFAAWIRDAVGDTVLYESFKDSKSRDHAVMHLKSYLKKIDSDPGLIQKLTSNNPVLKKIVEKMTERMRQDAHRLNYEGKDWVNTKFTIKDLALSVVIGIVLGIILAVAAII
jgi:hypothetical protein